MVVRPGPRRAVVALVLATGLAGCAPSYPPPIRKADDVQRLLVADPTPPAPGRDGWAPAPLPDYWGAAIRRRTLAGWYRTTVALDAPPGELWAVYLPRVSVTASVWVNGTLVGGSAAPLADPLPRDWILPHLFTVPREIWRAGPNEVDVRLQTHLGAPGLLRAVYVGPDRLLRPIHDRAYWWRIGLTQIVGATTFAAGLLMLFLSTRHVETRAWRWLGVGLLVWAWASADAFFRRPPVPTHLWAWSTGIAPLWTVVCFALGFHQVLERRDRRRDWLLVAIGVVVSAGALLLPPIHAFLGNVTAGVCAIAIAAYLAALFGRLPGSPVDRLQRRFVIPAVVGIALGLHDVVWITTGVHVADTLLSPYIAAVALMTGAWVLLARLVDAHRETLELNRELERRVAEKHRELEANYARLGELERHRAVASERERLMRDVHDGVGGQLVSTLALVEGGEAPAEAVAEAIRGALEDLRLVIDSLDPQEDDLLALLAAVRSRLEPRLARHGLRFAWQVSDLPPLPGFGPEMALQAMRIVQEAITNVVKHASAATVIVRTGESTGDGGAPGVYIEVADDGRGIAAGAPRGRGLANMRRRAKQIGGGLDVRSDGGGTTVRLWIPRQRPAA